MNQLKEILLENLVTYEKQKFNNLEGLKQKFKNDSSVIRFIENNQSEFEDALEHSYNCFCIGDWQFTLTAKKKTGKKKKGNGQGTTYFDNTRQCWAGQYTYNGKRKSPIYQRKDENKTQFIARFNNILSSISNGTFIDKNKETLHDILKRFIEQKYKDGITKPRAYNRNLSTLQSAEKTCSNFIYKPIQSVTVEDIEDAKDEIKKYKKTVIDKIWSMIYTGFKIATSRKKIIYNIMDDETLNKPISIKSSRKVLPLTADELKKLNQILDGPERNHKYRNIVKMEIITSMRVGEVLARSLDDLINDETLLHIHNTLTQDENGKTILGEHTKTYNKNTGIDEGVRDFPVDQELKEIIFEQKNNKVTNIYKLLFWDYRKNDFITPSQVNSWLHRINNKYHISNELHNHKIRHTVLTSWKEQGMDMSAIQYFAGHVEGSSITSDVYIDISRKFAINELGKIKNTTTA